MIVVHPAITSAGLSRLITDTGMAAIRRGNRLRLVDVPPATPMRNETEMKARFRALERAYLFTDQQEFD